MKSCTILALFTTLLVACTSPGTKRTDRADSGPAAGVLVGIASSDSARESKKRALAGAGIQALAGDAADYMDGLEARLRQKLEDPRVSMTRRGERLILHMWGNIAFADDTTRVRDDIAPLLAALAQVLMEYDQTMIQVGAHTNSTGAKRDNLVLSRKRAQRMADKLTGLGVAGVRIDPVGFGETQPFASNHTRAGRARNRRVELTLLPYTKK